MTEVRCSSVSSRLPTDARTAFARIARLAVQLARRASTLGCREAHAVRVHADPQAREATVERVDAARQQPGLRGLSARHAAESDEVRDRARGDVGRHAIGRAAYDGKPRLPAPK